MTFYKFRLIFRIGVIACRVLMVVYPLVGLILSIIYTVQWESGLPFAFCLPSGVGAGAISFLMAKFLEWMLTDFDDLDQKLAILAKEDEDILERMRKTMAVNMEVTKAAIKENAKQSESTESDNIEEIESTELLDEKVVEQLADDLSKKPVVAKESNEDEKDDSLVVVIKDSNALIIGDQIVLAEDFSDYGFEFKKGMKGILQDLSTDGKTVSVRMTDKIKGHFRFDSKLIKKPEVKKDSLKRPL